MTFNKYKNLFFTLILLSFFLLTGCVPYTTGTNEVGVVVYKWNPIGSQGVQNYYIGEGETHFFLPFITEWHTFSSNLQNIEMTITLNKGDKKERDDLLFKTIDGNDISLDVIVSYHIIKQKAPYILGYIAGDDQELRNNIVRTVSRSRPRDIFGELTTEEFYVSDNRIAKSNKTKEKMNKILEPYGVKVEAVLTKDYRFNPAYQKAIEERKIADQMAEKNQAAARAAKQEYMKKLQDAAGEVNKIKAEVDGDFLQGKIIADAYYTQQKLASQAIKIEGEAEAEGMKQMADSLTGKGGENLVKMKIAKALKGKKILLLPLASGGLDLKTTDINQLLETYGIQKVAPSHKNSTVKPASSTKTNDTSVKNKKTN